MTFDLFTQSLSAQEKLARLQLIRTDSIGPITFRGLLSRYGSAEVALSEIPSIAAKGGRKNALKIPAKSSIEQELAALDAFGATVIYLGESDYPVALAAVEDAPPVLFAKGHVHLLQKDIIGMVGARNASASGQRITSQLAAGLSDADIVVSSGMARGIDTAAHSASLKGGTIACVAGGLDIVYPKENEALYEAIIEQGVVVGENPLSTRPQARHFPRRNRLISGLSLGVVVIEAAKRSGSLITARLAGEQGREVYAVPGSPLDPRCQGTNELIKNGAKLTQCAEDIIEDIAALRARPLEDPSKLPLFAAARGADINTDSARQVIIELLSPTPVTLNEIIRLCDLDAGTVQAVILELELGGVAIRYPGNLVSLL